VVTETLVKIIPHKLKQRFSDKYKEAQQAWKKKS
jgi:hypothetical protein